MSVESDCADLFAWLVATFPTPYPVTLRWRGRISFGGEGRHLPKRTRARGIFGVTWFYGRRIEIWLSRRRCRSGALAEDTLIHEYAHAVTLRHDRIERHREADHDDEWALAYGRILRAYLERERLTV